MSIESPDELAGRPLTARSSSSPSAPTPARSRSPTDGSLLLCPSCRAGLEHDCRTGSILTYNSPDKFIGGQTVGGSSGSIVVDEAFGGPHAFLDSRTGSPIMQRLTWNTK